MSWTHRYFTSKEFACKCGCGAGEDLSDIDTELLNRLCTVRELHGPLMITSGARCIAHNAKEGGKPISAHITEPGKTKCRAADLLCLDVITRGALLPLIYTQFKRVGIQRSFIHVDVCGGPLYISPTTWLY